MTASEIREALDSTYTYVSQGAATVNAEGLKVLREAARAYADLLENGVEREFEDFEYYAFQAGRYLVVPVKPPEQKWCVSHDQDWETGDCDSRDGACRLRVGESP